MFDSILTFISGALIGVVAGIFFYRNNQSKVSKVADRIDDVVEDVKQATKKK